MEPAYVAAHIEVSATHWWFRARSRVLLACLRQALPRRRPLRLLELGCGTGHVLAALREFGEVVGMEPHADLAAVARRAGLDVRDGRLPGDLVVAPGWADVVLMLDVIEHLDDDRAALATARRALVPEGLLVVTAPAYAWLWSAHDVALGHRRRYTVSGLARLAEAAAFRVARLTCFNTLLFPALVVQRLSRRLRGDSCHDLGGVPRSVNAWLEHLFALERHVLPHTALPFGASVLMIARRGGGTP